MCGRYTLHTDPHRLAEHFQVPPPDLEKRYNIAPSQEVFAVRRSGGDREGVMLRWGLIPAWAKDIKVGYRMINARAETVAGKPAFRAAFRRRRCLIPADGFYEWQPGPGGKQPYHIRVGEGEPFAFAGLWEHWEGDQVVESCTILVTSANDTLRPIHDRMPVILEPGDYEQWLDTERFNAARLEALLKPYPSDRISFQPVSKRVNSPANTGPECIAPLPA